MSQASGCLILIIEDSEDDAFLLTGLLRKHGVQNPIQVVRDGVEAISYLCRSSKPGDCDEYASPGIIFLDVRMPRVDGFEVLRWIQRQPYLRDVMIVVLSVLSRVEDFDRAYHFGANTFLTKPCSAVDLENLIHSFPGRWIIPPFRATPPPPPLPDVRP